MKKRNLNDNLLPSNLRGSVSPWFITGLVDAEGSFIVNIIKDDARSLGFLVLFQFEIGLNEKDKVLLEMLKEYFGAGNIFYSSKDETFRLKVSNLDQLQDIIIPHFDKYPLISQKQGDYLLFKDVISRMLNKEHLTREGLEQIAAIKASLNLGLPEKIKQAFPSVIPVQRPTTFKPVIPHAKWMQGFTTGEGCFYVNIFKSSHHNSGFQVRVEFELAQHIRDSLLIESVKDYLCCGIVSSYSKGMVKFKCIRFTDISSIIIPFFKEHYPLGNKRLDFVDFCIVAKLMEDKVHLSEEGLEQIRNVKAGMNTKRVN